MELRGPWGAGVYTNSGETEAKGARSTSKGPNGCLLISLVLVSLVVLFYVVPGIVGWFRYGSSADEVARILRSADGSCDRMVESVAAANKAIAAHDKTALQHALGDVAPEITFSRENLMKGIELDPGRGAQGLFLPESFDSLEEMRRLNGHVYWAAGAMPGLLIAADSGIWPDSGLELSDDGLAEDAYSRWSQFASMNEASCKTLSEAVSRL